LAEQVRARLAMSINHDNFVYNGATEEEVTHVLEERFHGKSVRSHVRSFGVLFAFISLGLAFYGSSGRWTVPINGCFIGLAVLFYLCGVMKPLILYPLWKGWMGLAKILNAVVTPLLLTVLWIVLVIPLSYIMRVVGVKAMDLSYDRSRDSYWKTRKDTKQDFSLLERQY
jgi:hypothetical protein